MQLFGVFGCVTSSERLDGGTVNWIMMRIQEFYHSGIRGGGNCTNFAGNSTNCRRILTNILKEWGASLATNRLILVLIWIWTGARKYSI